MLQIVVLIPALTAQESTQPKRLHFDFAPFVGYRTSMVFPIAPLAAIVGDRVVVDASPSYGFSFGMARGRKT
jgi:hypothetical protein